ncbi:MAG: hypothetical protein P1V51_08825 [Deltaproteobacteria bacterium]|nr:hypothetical protein [Deltaproteobacteria bacterium]
MAQLTETGWKKCSTCKREIALGARYWLCSVSTCNQKRTGLAFCSVDCWDSHVPLLRHRDAWAKEATAPTSHEAGDEAPKKRRLMGADGSEREQRERRPEAVDPDVAAAARRRPLEEPPPDEILVVASKVKAYIKARSDLNTSAAVMEALSDKVRAACDEAIRSAWAHERKTVLDRDV